MQERQEFIKTQLDDLEIQIEATKDGDRDIRQADLAVLFSSRQIADAQSQIGALQAKQTALQNNYASLLTNSQQGAINSLSVFEPATLPVQPVGTQPNNHK